MSARYINRRTHASVRPYIFGRRLQKTPLYVYGNPPAACAPDRPINGKEKKPRATMSVHYHIIAVQRKPTTPKRPRETPTQLWKPSSGLRVCDWPRAKQMKTKGERVLPTLLQHTCTQNNDPHKKQNGFVPFLQPQP